MSAHDPRQKGFTLVELMIAMALGLFLVGAAVSVVLANRQTFRIAENQSRLQENARSAFELMAHDIRSAGGNSCGSNPVYNNLTNSAAIWWANWAAGPVLGFENSAAGDGAQGIVPVGVAPNNRIAGSDAIVVMSANAGETVVAAQDFSAAAPPYFRVTNNQHGVTRGSILMVCDKASAAIFEATNAAVGTTTIEHDVGGVGAVPGAPGNLQASLVANFDSGAILARLRSSFWYVGKNSRGSNSLFRLGVDGQAVPGQPLLRLDEVIEGVDITPLPNGAPTGLQIQYMVRTPATGATTTWVPATAVAAWPYNPAQPRVEAVQITLYLQSRDQVGVNAAGAAQALKTVLNETIYLRNREYTP